MSGPQTTCTGRIVRSHLKTNEMISPPGTRLKHRGKHLVPCNAGAPRGEATGPFTKPVEGDAARSQEVRLQALWPVEQPICRCQQVRLPAGRQYDRSPSVGGVPCRENKERGQPFLDDEAMVLGAQAGARAQENERTMDGFRSVRRRQHNGP
jgi:hypothetical protein